MTICEVNMLVEKNVKQAREIIQRAAAIGFNGVVLADTKTCTWFHADFHMPAWEQNVKSLRNRSRQLGLEFRVHVMPFGSAGGILSHDVNLATGYPINATKLRAHPVIHVKPFHQYRVRVWMKCEALSGWFAVMAKTEDGSHPDQMAVPVDVWPKLKGKACGGTIEQTFR